MIPPVVKIKKIKRKEVRIDPEILLKAANAMNIPKNIKWQVDGNKLILRSQEVRVGTSILNPLNKNIVNKLQEDFKQHVRAQLHS